VTQVCEIYNLTDHDVSDNLVSVLSVALEKVEAITGQTPTLPVMKSEQKLPALTADALKLDPEVEPTTDVTKAVTPTVQSVRIQHFVYRQLSQLCPCLPCLMLIS